MDRPSVLLHAEDTATGPPRRSRAPVVERIAGWSARHRKTALIGWLLLVADAVMIGSMLGTKNLNSYDPRPAGPNGCWPGRAWCSSPSRRCWSRRGPAAVRSPATLRRLEVLRLLAAGRSNQRIAHDMLL
jgi:hypothetical protein